jgi:hypothetical protein
MYQYTNMRIITVSYKHVVKTRSWNTNCKNFILLIFLPSRIKKLLNSKSFHETLEPAKTCFVLK